MDFDGLICRLITDDRVGAFVVMKGAQTLTGLGPLFLKTE